MSWRQADLIQDNHGPVAKLIFETVLPHKFWQWMVSLIFQSLVFVCSHLVTSIMWIFLLRTLGFREKMVEDLKVAQHKRGWGLFIDSCFNHCQTPFRITWHSPISLRLGNKVRFRVAFTVSCITAARLFSFFYVHLFIIVLKRFSFNSFFFHYSLAEQTIADAVADWYVGKDHGVKEIDCAYPCINPTCSSQLDL